MGSYWRRVLLRGWKATVATSPWASALRLFAGVAGPAGAAVVGWWQTGQWQLSAVYALAGAAAVFLLFLGLNTVVVAPAAMDAEQGAKIAQLEAEASSFYGQHQDVSLDEAVTFLALGQWGRGGDVVRMLGADVHRIVRQLGVAAHREWITIWGRAGPNTLHVPVPKDLWELEGIDYLELFERRAVTTKSRPLTNTRYTHLMLSKAQVMRLRQRGMPEEHLV